MANKYDLKTWVKVSLAATTDAATNIGSSVVPTGKTRFLTYIRVQRKDAAVSSIPVKSLLIGIGSIATSKPTGASIMKATALKMPIHFPAASGTGAVLDSPIIQEIRGSIDHPILTVAGGSFMGIAASDTAAEKACVFAQYYDE